MGSLILGALPYAIAAMLAAPIVLVVSAPIIGKAERPVRSASLFVLGAVLLDVLFAAALLAAYRAAGMDAGSGDVSAWDRLDPGEHSGPQRPGSSRRSWRRASPMRSGCGAEPHPNRMMPVTHPGGTLQTTIYLGCRVGRARDTKEGSADVRRPISIQGQGPGGH